MSNAAKRFEAVTSTLEAGKTVYICTHGARPMSVTPKVYNAWKDHGGLFKVNDKSLYIRKGKRWDCLDFTLIQVDKQKRP